MGGDTGRLVINADDWGRDRDTTDRILECTRAGSVSSVSGMVFMEDSERAAAMTRSEGIDTGLHLNFTTPFSTPARQSRLLEQQRRITRHLLMHRFAPVVFHPGLIAAFDYVVAAQVDEFRRLYDAEPNRIDGHHHMHLCANVMLQKLLPPGIRVRRNFSFRADEKGGVNRLYRRCVDRGLARRHVLTDFFFTLRPIGPPDRLPRIFSMAGRSTVEVAAHPVDPEEHRFLTGGEIFRTVGDLPIASSFTAAG